MRTIDDIRHDRLLQLIQEAGSIKALADKLGRSHAQISNLKTRAKQANGTRKAIGSALARDIETAVGKPTGWMDTDPHVCCSGAPAEYSEQPALPTSRAVAWRAAADQFATVMARRGAQVEPETFLLFVDAALEEEEKEISEAVAERILNRWLPVLSKGRVIGHAPT